jgi:hypothetical protein
MARPLDELPLILQRYRKQAADTVNRIAREAARQGGGYLAADTAVDTGEARSNWVMTLDAPFEGVIPPYSPFPKLGNAAATAGRKEETANLSAVQAQHAAASAAFSAERNYEIVIRNNVPHIGDIEGGSSPQTAAGLLVRGLEAARRGIAGMWHIAPIGL